MANKNYPLYPVKPFGSIKEMLAMAVAEAGDRDAFRFKSGDGQVAVTYREFEERTFALGTALADLGMAQEHIAIISENRYEYVCAYLTVLKSTGVFVPVDKELPPHDLDNVVTDSDSTAMFVSEKYEKIALENPNYFAGIKYFICFDRAVDSEDGKFLSYRLLVEKGAALYRAGNKTYTDMKSDPQALKLLVYTSGTTGLAKGVMLSEHNLCSCVYYGLQVSGVYDVCLSVLPYNHTYEAVAGLLVSLHHHATICINDNLRNVLKNLNFYKPQYIYLVPAFVELFYKKIWSTARQSGKEQGLRALISMSRGMRRVGIDLRKKLFASIHKSFGGNLIKIVCGGAPIRPELGRFFEDIGITLVNGYGITECSPLVSANRDRFNDCRTVGSVLPCVKIRFDDVNDDGIGEICVKGDTVMLGYYKHPELTAEVLDEDGWFHTGDYGCMNNVEQLMITGRKKNLIILANGKNIFPEEIENDISAIPYVSEVVVYGHRDEKGMETALYAEIYCAPEKLEEFQIADVAQSLKDDVAKVCAHLPEYKHIAKIITRDTEFVKTTTNKIRRNCVEKQ